MSRSQRAPWQLAWIVLAIAACTGPTPSTSAAPPSAVAPSPLPGSPGAASPVPSANFDTTGILLVAVDEQIQPSPPTEALAVALSRTYELAEANGTDLGYPWFDAVTGELVLSAATPAGRELLETADVRVPYRIRDVAYGFAELKRIQEDVTHLRGEGVPDADRIFGTGPDQRDNRTTIWISAMSRPLLDALAARFPVDAIAVRVDPSLAP